MNIAYSKVPYTNELIADYKRSLPKKRRAKYIIGNQKISNFEKIVTNEDLNLNHPTIQNSPENTRKELAIKLENITLLENYPKKKVQLVSTGTSTDNTNLFIEKKEKAKTKDKENYMKISINARITEEDSVMKDFKDIKDVKDELKYKPLMKTNIKTILNTIGDSYGLKFVKNDSNHKRLKAVSCLKKDELYFTNV